MNEAPAPVPETGETARAGMAALVGRANAGKSTLLNALLGEKISIVSPVAQTTRNVIRGVLTEPRGQLVFLDTPGVHKAQTDLGKLMNRTARSAVEGVDVAALILDASVPPQMEDEGWMRRLLFGPATVVGVLNKRDRPDDHAAAYRSRWDEVGEAKGRKREILWAETSALKGTGVEALIRLLFAQAPCGPPLFPEDVLTDFPRRLAMADVIREKYFHHLTQELPHRIAVWIEELDESGEAWRVAATLYVTSTSQKGIVIGRKGSLIKRVRHEAEGELSAMFDRPVDLDLWVKVEKDWPRNFWFLRRLGYA